MRQNVDDTTDPSFGPRHVPLIRAEMQRQGLDAFLIPHEDEHQNEYLPEANDRLAWATGFTGSAGAAALTGDKAAIFVDGRYTLQVRDQVDVAVFEPVPVMEVSVADWLKANAAAGQRIGYDPWLMTRAQVRQIAKKLAAPRAELVPLDANPVDAVWRDRPEPPIATVTLQSEELAGRPTAEKIPDIAR